MGQEASVSGAAMGKREQHHKPITAGAKNTLKERESAKITLQHLILWLFR